MASDPRRRLPWPRPAFGRLGFCLLILAGCVSDRAQVNRALRADRGNSLRNQGVSDRYCLHCPDVLLLDVPGRADLSGARQVGADGRIDVGGVGRLRLEGRTVPEATRLVAMVAGEDPARVNLRVAAFRSQQIYLFGPGVAPQRSAPYEGQETVLDFLKRVGGIASGAAPNDVYVVRPHVDEGKPPEVFHVDLESILLRNDPKTNVRVLPFDEVHVGETRQSAFEKYVPPILRPVYEAACGLSRKLPFVDKLRGEEPGAAPAPPAPPRAAPPPRLPTLGPIADRSSP